MVVVAMPVRIKLPEAAQQTAITAVANSSSGIVGTGKAPAGAGFVATGGLGADDPNQQVPLTMVYTSQRCCSLPVESLPLRSSL